MAVDHERYAQTELYRRIYGRMEFLHSVLLTKIRVCTVLGEPVDEHLQKFFECESSPNSIILLLALAENICQTSRSQALIERVLR